ncbi:MAG: Stp1/IreP family PP2C-type Ser/Thr phosphatase [Clostridia bacterium]|nr:Stp1/IreP family PP2C-type Ser/Thr phosphatase [Clostridia bacterium]
MIYGQTDVGNVRTLNEDSFYFETTPQGYVMIVADGMGGHNGGEVASKMAVDSIREYMNQNDIFSDPEVTLRQAIKCANDAVFHAATKQAELEGMGTTLVMAVGNEKTICVANVGDSRAYLVSKNKLLQITKDHSFVNELVKKGVLTKEEAKKHPKSNIILKALGLEADVYPDIFLLEKKKTDKVLLCTDGLTGMVSDEEILEVMAQFNKKNACAELVRLAKEHGGTDNVTVVIG